MISSRLVHFSDTGFLRIVRAVIASPFRNQNVFAGLHPETDEHARFHPVFGLRSICQRTHSIPHSPNAHLPVWYPRPRHRSNGTFPSDPTVSRFSNVAACPNIQAMVFDFGGICIWQLNSSSFMSVLTMPPTSSTALSANQCPA